MKSLSALPLALSALLLPLCAAASADAALPAYQPAQGLSGNFSSIGSDSLNNLMTLWAEQFKRHHPSINIQVQGAGSSTAPPALTEGTANFGPMSRLMKSQEIQAFERKYGYPPTAVGVAIDALALFVNQDNPLQSLDMTQVDAIFSPTRRCGAHDPALRWGDLGLTGPWAGMSVQLFGRNSVSGTYGYFKDKALCKGDFKDRVNEQPGSASVVQSVSSSPYSLGYSGIGYRTAGVRALKLAKKPGGAAYEPSIDNALAGRYPLSRTLYVYVNKPPNRPLPALEAEFLRLVLSHEGQQVVLKDGYIPLPAAQAAREMAKLR